MEEVAVFKSTHELDFLARPWKRDEKWVDFRVGTCSGLYFSTSSDYIILAIVNNTPGNGHFNDVLEWFENSCQRDKKRLVISEVHNIRLFYHLLSKRGFKKLTDSSVVKYFDS